MRCPVCKGPCSGKWCKCTSVWTHRHGCLSLIKCSLSCYLVWSNLSLWTGVKLASLQTCHISDMLFWLFLWTLAQTAHCFMHFLPLSVNFFHFAMECPIWGIKTSCRAEQCGMPPSPNLILAVLKIVCVLSRTDRPLFPESCCWKQPLCASSVAPRPHEIFTGQHMV